MSEPTRAQRDWGMDVEPDHYASEGCCELAPGEHPMTPEEAQARRGWDETEPGLRLRLQRREASFARMSEQGVPDVMLNNQRRMVNDIRRRLGEPVLEGEEWGP